MKARTTECAALFFDREKIVWDDFLSHRQLALTDTSIQVLRLFATWQEFELFERARPDLAPVARRLLEAELLIAENSPRHRRERQLMAAWRAWGPAARHHHFSSRSHDEARYLTLEEDQAHARQKAAQTPPPAAFKTYPDQPLVAMPDQRPSDAAWPRPGLLDALYQRRSTRTFADDPLSFERLAALLQVSAGIVDIIDDPLTGSSVFKTSPSAGARNPIEVYLYAGRVSQLPPGTYHYAPTRSGLERLGPAVGAEQLLSALGGQPWLVEAPALLIYTAVIERSQWRYPTKRAYGDILIGLGHVSQTALTTASAMGLGAVTATAVRDTALERLVAVDPIQEPVLAVTAVGEPAQAPR